VCLETSGVRKVAESRERARVMPLIQISPFLRIHLRKASETPCCDPIAARVAEGPIEEETVRSDFSEEARNDIQQVVEWVRQYADTLDPLSRLPEAIEEFVRPESKYWWLE
jgi:hypothetical protein